jgi:hypothetical protein
MDRELDEILEELGREHRANGAPGRLEPMLRAAAERGKSSHDSTAAPLRWVWAVVMILMFGAATAGVILKTRKAGQTGQQVRTLPIPQPMAQAPQGSVSPSTPVVRHQPAPANRSALRRTASDRAGLRSSSRKPAAFNSLDEFVPLPASEGLPPASAFTVVRMNVRGSDLEQYGLRAPVDAVAQTRLAEFAVGEDGLPRAIRIIR